MALIGCPECKKEISSEAIRCVHCGRPKSDAELFLNLSGFGQWFKILIIIGCLCFLVGFILAFRGATTAGGIAIGGGINLIFIGILFLLIRSLR